jgi:hypothetical protein
VKIDFQDIMVQIKEKFTKFPWIIRT